MVEQILSSSGDTEGVLQARSDLDELLEVIRSSGHAAIDEWARAAAASQVLVEEKAGSSGGDSSGADDSVDEDAEGGGGELLPGELKLAERVRRLGLSVLSGLQRLDNTVLEVVNGWGVCSRVPGEVINQCDATEVTR